MWECGLKSPQAEEASNPSLNGGPSAVARNAADHRLSCIIDSSPVSVAKSIRMLLHPLSAAVPPQASAPAPALSLSVWGLLQAGASSPRGLFVLLCQWVSAVRLNWCRQGKRHPLRGGCSPLFLRQKVALLVLIIE